jgi:hypothetical protein
MYKYKACGGKKNVLPPGPVSCITNRQFVKYPWLRGPRKKDRRGAGFFLQTKPGVHHSGNRHFRHHSQEFIPVNLRVPGEIL